MTKRPHPIMLYGHQVQFNARMLATLHHRLKCYAVESGRSMTDCLNDALTEFLRVHADPDTAPEEDA